jgi:hypothetical protein
MKTLKFAFLGLVLGSTASLADDCVAPNAPQVPVGSSSTLEQMLAGQKSVKEFQAANLEYMACLEPLLAAAEAEVKAGTEGAAEKYQQIQDTYNAAVSREEEVAGQFNTEIRDYKAANPG